MIPFFLLLSYLLEVTIKYYLPTLNNLYIYLEPMFFVSFLIIYIIIYHKQKKSLYFIIFSTIIYDFFFGNVLFLYSLIFLILYYFINFICSRFQNNLLTNIIIFIICLILFLLLKYITLLWIGYNYSLIFLLTQIQKTLIINLIYGLIIYCFLGIKLRKA